MVEVWKPVEGYGGLYEVSNYGNVMSLQHGKPRLLKLLPTPFGYLRVHLHRNGFVRDYFVHRLVAMHFLPNPDCLPQINHKDECKTNNRVDNLEWCTSSYNMNYGQISPLERARKALSRPVEQYTKDGELVGSYESAVHASRETGVLRRNICACCRGEYGNKTAGGYVWKFKEE